MNGIPEYLPPLSGTQKSADQKAEDNTQQGSSDYKAALKCNKALRQTVDASGKPRTRNGRDVDRGAPPERYTDRARKDDKATQSTYKTIIKFHVRSFAPQKPLEKQTRTEDFLEEQPEECIGLDKDTVEELRKLGIVDYPKGLDKSKEIGLSPGIASILHSLGYLAESEISSDEEKGASDKLTGTSDSLRQPTGTTAGEKSSPQKPMHNQQKMKSLSVFYADHSTESTTAQIRGFLHWLCCCRKQSLSSEEGKREKRRSPM